MTSWLIRLGLTNCLSSSSKNQRRVLSVTYKLRSWTAQPSLYPLLQLQVMEYTQFWVIFSLMSLRFLCRLELLLNIVLMLYGLQVFWMFSDKPLIKGRQTMSIFWSFPLTLLFPPVGTHVYRVDVILKGMLDADQFPLVCIWIATYNFCVVCIRWPFSSHCMDDGNWSMVHYSLACDIWMCWTPSLC